MDKHLRNTVFDLEDVSELSEEVLELCMEEAGVLNADQVANFYMNNDDHGISHSQAVWNRCQEIISQSPLVWQMAQIQVANQEVYARKVLILASIFHDIGRFLGASFETHEAMGAKLAKRIICGSYLDRSLFDAIINHDYICPLINGHNLPQSLMFPLSEIFRLADKTSISPQNEIIRYHKTGRRIASDLPLFDPTISDDDRFNFKSNTKKGDELTWFLIIFALQSTDFLYGDTRDAYAYWARGKKEALKTIGDLCLQEEYLAGKTPIDPEEAKAVVVRFCKKHNLIIST